MLCIEQCVVNALLASLMPKSGNVVQLAGDVAFVRGCGSQAFGVTVSVPFFRSPEAPVVKKVHLKARVEVEDDASSALKDVKPQSTTVCVTVRLDHVPSALEDVKPQSASVAQPGVHDAGARNALTHDVAETVLDDMKSWYAERVDDESVANTWKHVHTVLFKKVQCC